MERGDRRRVVVYAQVNGPVIQPLGTAPLSDHEQRRGLLPPAVTTGGLRRGERRY